VSALPQNPSARGIKGTPRRFVVQAPRVFYPTLVIIVAVVIVAISFPVRTGATLATLQGWVVAGLGPFYIILVAGFVVFAVRMGVSRFGDIKRGVSGNPQELASAAMSQTFLHWEFHAWAIYAVIGLSLAYSIHRKGRPVSIRWALEPLLGDRVRGRLGVVGEVDNTLLVVLIIVIIAIATLSVASGVGKGIKWLSNINLGMAGLLLLAVLLLGPMLYLLRVLVESIGGYFQNVIGLTFDTGAYAGQAGIDWQGAWTIFYWGWWISWAPFVGVFIARISRGRPVREFVAGVLLVPTLVTFVVQGTQLRA
jgi:choline/glycine/proline betaine transport protein